MVYKNLIEYRKRLSGSEMIVYSNIILESLLHYAEVYDINGKYSNFGVECVIESSKNLIQLKKPEYEKIRERTGLSKDSIFRCIKSLTKKRIIRGNLLFVKKEIVQGGFVELANCKLQGHQLIFFSILLNRAQYFHGTIDTWARKMAQEFHTTQNNVYVMINRLKKKGFMERSEKGMLVIKKMETRKASPSVKKFNCTQSKNNIVITTSHLSCLQRYENNPTYANFGEGKSLPF